MNTVVVAAADYLAAWDAKRVGALPSGSLSFRLRMRGEGRTGIALEAALKNDPRWQILVTETGLGLRARWADGWRTHTAPVASLDNGAWHHIVLSSGAGRVKVWVDGDLIYQAPGEAWFADGVALPGGIDELVIGRALGGERLMGEVADATFYDAVLSHEEALAVMGFAAPKVHRVLINHDGMSYRIPALVVVDDTMILVADRRHNGPGDAPNVIDLVCTRSEDAGETWSDPVVIVSPFQGGASTDACLLHDPATGKIWAFFSAYAPGHSQPAVLRKESGAKALIQVVTSTDAGATWSDPWTITPTNANPSVRCLGVSPGAGAVMADGTFLVPAYHEVIGDDRQTNFAATVLTSSDGGVSWQVGNPVYADGHPTYESTVFEGTPGEIVLMARNQHPSGCVLRAASPDLGHTWQDVTFLTDVPEIFSQPSSTRLPDGRVAFCNPSAMLPYRGWGVVRISSDHGKTWPVSRTVNAERHGYQSIAVRADGAIVVAWEHEWDSINVTVLPPPVAPIHA